MTKKTNQIFKKSPKILFLNEGCPKGEKFPNNSVKKLMAYLRGGGTPLAAENHCNALFGFYNPCEIHITIYGGFLSNPAVILLPTRMSRDVAL